MQSVEVIILDFLLKEILKNPSERFVLQSALLKHVGVSRNYSKIMVCFLIRNGVCDGKIANTYAMHGCGFHKDILDELGVQNDSLGMILFDQSKNFERNLWEEWEYFPKCLLKDVKPELFSNIRVVNFIISQLLLDPKQRLTPRHKTYPHKKKINNNFHVLADLGFIRNTSNFIEGMSFMKCHELTEFGWGCLRKEGFVATDYIKKGDWLQK